MASNVAGQVARRLQKIEAEIKGAQHAAVNKAALELKSAVDREIVTATGDRRMSGVGRGGAKVGVRYDIKGTKNPTALVRALGPLHLIERGTKPHLIPKQRGRRRRVVAFNGVVRASAQHPGTRGRYPFAKGIDAGRHAAVKALRRAQHDALVRGFR